MSAVGDGELDATTASMATVDVPREDELLHWLNTFLQSRYRQIEDLRDSIAFAQIMVRGGQHCCVPISCIFKTMVGRSQRFLSVS